MRISDLSRGQSPRVASLLPSATEIVCGLGAREALVGVSHECDFPPEVEGLPVLTRARLAPPGRAQPDSAQIDREIRRVLESGLAIYEVDVDALARAAPDVILTQDLCEVCAVSLEDVKKAARTLGNPAVAIVSLRPTRLAHILRDIGVVGAALGREREAEKLVAALTARIEAVRRRTYGTTPRSVLTIEWLSPVMVGGTWMPELVEIAGGRALVTKPGEPAPTLSREELALLSPDVVVVKPCGFSLERLRREISGFLEGVRDLGWPATATGSVWLADGSAYFNRPGPRIVDSLEILAACVHPALFPDLAAKHARGFDAAFPRQPGYGSGNPEPLR